MDIKLMTWNKFALLLSSTLSNIIDVPVPMDKNIAQYIIVASENHSHDQLLR